MNPLLVFTVAAVLADSIVTVAVGLRLNSTAERKIEEGVRSIIEKAPTILAEAMTKEGTQSGERES